MINRFEAEIKVDKNIVPLLSKSTYQRSFSEAVRELVSNSYDADALTVKIYVDSKFNNVIVEDDGNGMTKNDFNKYITIARKKGESSQTKKYKRHRIGQFGIGFLAIFPFCEELKITTTTENSDEILTASIPTKEFFDSLNEINESQLIEEIKVHGSIFENSNDRLKHYTKFELIKPTYFLKNYFKRPETKKRSSVINWDPLERFKWELQEDLPLEFERESSNEAFVKYQETIGLTVFLNNKKIFRNPLCENLLEKGEKTFGKFKYKYIITTDHKSIIPTEARGIKIRVNNIGIGRRTDFFLKRDRGFARLHWITGEIYISENFKEYLNLNRTDFISDSSVDEIFEGFSEILRKNAYALDKISEAEKELLNIDLPNRTALVKPKSEILTENIEKLKNVGFEIVQDEKLKNSHVKIDKAKRVVFVGNFQEIQVEQLEISTKVYNIIYKKWDVSKPPCKVINNNIEINLEYPLFKSKTYGNLFKKLHIIFLIARQENRTSEEMYSDILSKLNEEFKEFY